jgi:hypothetical protein
MVYGNDVNECPNVNNVEEVGVVGDDGVGENDSSLG